MAKVSPLVVVGGTATATTSAMCAWILECAGLEPGFSIGGIERAAGSKRKIIGSSAKPPPFVMDGGDVSTEEGVFVVAIVTTSVASKAIDKHDVVEELARKIPEEGLIVCDARDRAAREIVSRHARSRTSFYAIDGDDTGDESPTWLGALVPVDTESGASGAQPFDLFIGGSSCGRFALSKHCTGADNVRSAIAAVAACAEGFGVDVERARQALSSFVEGVTLKSLSPTSNDDVAESQRSRRQPPS